MSSPGVVRTAYRSSLLPLLLRTGVRVEGKCGYTSIFGLFHNVLLGVLCGGGIMGQRLLLLLFLLLTPLLLALGFNGILVGGHGAGGPCTAGCDLV